MQPAVDQIFTDYTDTVSVAKGTPGLCGSVSYSVSAITPTLDAAQQADLLTLLLNMITLHPTMGSVVGTYTVTLTLSLPNPLVADKTVDFVVDVGLCAVNTMTLTVPDATYKLADTDPLFDWSNIHTMTTVEFIQFYEAYNA